MEKHIMPNNILLPEIGRMVSEGMLVTLRGKGNSMLPFIVGGRDSVVLSRPMNLKKYDIVLARIDNERYVLHRIIKLGEEHITLMGDGNLVGKEKCVYGDVLAKVIKIVRNGQYIYTGRKSERRKAVLWIWFRPVRRLLLAIYRRFPNIN